MSTALLVRQSNAVKREQFPQRTTSPTARRLHALLRYSPGYHELGDSNRVQWVLDSLLSLSHRSDLPVGCMDAVCELQAVYLPPSLTRCLSVDQLCKIVVEIGRYCAYRRVVEDEFVQEQARRKH